MAATSNSQDPPPIDLSSTGVGVLSPLPNDTDIVIAGDVISLQLSLSVTRQVMVVAMCTNEPVGVSRHITNAGDGTWVQARVSRIHRGGHRRRPGRLQLTGTGHHHHHHGGDRGRSAGTIYLVLAKQ